jgi:hypothetical protein
MRKFQSLLAPIIISLLATGIPAGAKPPDRSFAKFDKDMYGSPGDDEVPTPATWAAGTKTAGGGVDFSGSDFSGSRSITVKIPPGAIVDASYNQGTVACHGSGRNQHSVSTTVPGGVYVEVSGHDGRCSVSNIALTETFDEGTHTLSGYSLAADLSCSGICNVSLNAWIKLRPRLPSDVTVEPPSNSSVSGTSGPETPRGAVLSQKGLFAYVSKSDLGNQVQLDVTFVAPKPVPGAPAPYDRIQFYCYRRLANNQPVAQFLPYATCPDIHGKWEPGESAKFTVNVPKAYSDPANGWKVRFAICKTGKACVEASPNLLEMKPAP